MADRSDTEAIEAALRAYQNEKSWNTKHKLTVAIDGYLAASPGLVELNEDELYWLEGAAGRASQDQIATGLGTKDALLALSAKLKEAQSRG